MNLKLRNSVPAALLLAVAAISAVAQKPTRPVTLRPFEPAEELFYEAELSRGILRKLDVAEFRLKAQRSKTGKTNAQPTQNPDTLVLKCDIASKGFFPKLFGLRFRETLESTVDPASFAVQTSKRLDEHGKRTRSSEAIFDQTRGKVSWTEIDPKDPQRPPRVVKGEFTGSVHDILSAIYFMRIQPLQVGKSFELPISDSGQVYKVPVRVLEKKRLKTVLGRVDAILVEADLFGSKGMLNGTGKFFMWFTDDARRVPVSVKIKSEYGTFDIKLKKFTHNPVAQQYVTRHD
ncbi:MAG: DUF3108 domain-containing protein [Acidobacteriota bacterium]|nr:DUF3108 domain-containing protein [Acidobacteriota bacterium]